MSFVSGGGQSVSGSGRGCTPWIRSRQVRTFGRIAALFGQCLACLVTEYRRSSILGDQTSQTLTKHLRLWGKGVSFVSGGGESVSGSGRGCTVIRKMRPKQVRTFERTVIRSMRPKQVRTFERIALRLPCLHRIYHNRNCLPVVTRGRGGG